MLIKNFLRDRRSSRQFRHRHLKKKTLDSIREAINELMEETEDLNIGFKLYEDGKHIYKELEGIGGYTGVMIESPHYIGIEVRDDNDRTEINAGYYGEKLMTEIINLGVEACWVTMNHVDDEKRREVFGERGEYTDFVFAIGHPTLKNPFLMLADKVGDSSSMQKGFVSGTGHEDIDEDLKYSAQDVSDRMKVNRFVFKDRIENEATVEDMEDIGHYDTFYYIRYAPSSKNSQPWRFLIDDSNKIKLLLAYNKQNEYTPVDAGVMMYYFEEIMRTIGTRSTWKFIDGEEEGEKFNYKYIAEFEI